MEIIKLETKEQFDNLKKGDIILVEWKAYAREYKSGNTVTHHNMHSINRLQEIILDKRKNTYFSIENYLNGESIAREAYLVKSKA